MARVHGLRVAGDTKGLLVFLTANANLAVSTRLLRQAQGRLLVPDTSDAIRTMPRVRRGTGLQR